MEIKHILVPVDFSPCSLNALRIAAKMAMHWEGKVFITHALQIPDSYMTIAGTYTPVDFKQMKEEVTAAFESLPEQVKELNFVEYETQEVANDLLEGLFSTIQSKQVDMIVMGTKSEHDRLERVIGTHAADVIESVNIPVLMIPGELNLLEAKKIGLATDGKSIVNTNRLGYIAAIAEWLSAEIEVFFVGKAGENIDFEFSANKKVIDRYFDSFPHHYLNVVSKDTLKGILASVDENHIDLLAMIPRHHDIIYKWIHGSTTRHMAQHIAIPLMALPE